MKMHLNFATANLRKSVAFYSTLFNSQPTKLMEDYALFITAEPALELALDVADLVSTARDVHYGIFMETADGVERAIARLEGAGLVSSIERGETCCYAKQTKVWALDPDGRRWEVYTVHEDTEARDGGETWCCVTASYAGR